MRAWQGHSLDGDLGVHSEAWDRLNECRFRSHPLLDSRFWDSMLRHFGQVGVELWVLYEDGHVRAMCLLEHKGWGRWQTFKPSQAPIAPVMIESTDMIDDLFRDLRPLAVQLDLLCMDPGLCPLEASPSRHLSIVLHARTMDIDTNGGFDAYWAQRSSGLRQNLRRNERLADAAGIQFEHRVIDQPGEMAAAVERYAALESRGWKGAQGTALFEGCPQSRFYAELLLIHGLSGQAVVHELWHGPRLAASRLMLRGGGTKVMLKTAYDESLAKYAAGWRLLAHTLQTVFADPCAHKVDFYTDAHQGQLAWATGFRWIRHLTFFRQDARGALLHTLHGARQAVGAAGPRPPAKEALSVTRLDMSQPWPRDVSALIAQSAKESIEVSQPWFQNLHATVFDQHPEAALWVLSKNGQAVAALPLVVDSPGGSRRLKALANYYTAFFAPALAPDLKSEELAELFRHLIRHYRSLGRMSFEPMDPHSDRFHLLFHALQLAGLVCNKYFRFGNWYLQPPSSWEAYLSGRTANQRSAIRRSSKKLANAGGRIEIATGPAEVDRALAAYWRVYSASWKQNEPHPGFINGLARWTASQGLLRLGLAWLDDRPVGVQLWLVSHGKAEIFKLAYDESFKHYNPGNMLTAALIRHVIECDGVHEIDYLIGDDPYKKTWMSHRRERWGIEAYHPKRLNGILGLLQEIAGRAVHLAKAYWQARAAQ